MYLKFVLLLHLYATNWKVLAANYFYTNVCSGVTASRILLENLSVDDDLLTTLSSYLSQLQTFGLKNYYYITSEGIKRAFQQVQYLQTFQVIQCLQVDSSVLAWFAHTKPISKYFYRILTESSGFMNIIHKNKKES